FFHAEDGIRGFHVTGVQTCALPISILPWLSRTARDLGLWLVAGTLPLPPEGAPRAKPRACSLVIDERGERVARYDKLHLFDVERSEERRVGKEGRAGACTGPQHRDG